jgi:hypothetical protein
MPVRKAMTPAFVSPRFFTVSDIANCLDVAPRSVWRWIKSGDLPVHRFGADHS